MIPRIEGGAFYLGSEDYENGIKDVIQGALDYLGFTHDQLILSGLSMGSFELYIMRHDSNRQQ